MAYYKEYPNKKRAIQMADIQDEVESALVLIWECQICGHEHKSEEGATVEEFVKQLYDEGVRKVEMDMMIGVFCKDCYTDPEIQESTL